MINKKKPNTKENAKERVNFLPNFCDAKVLLLIVVMAEILSMILTLGPIESMQSRWTEFGINSLFIQWITLSTAAILCVFQGFTQKWQPCFKSVAVVVFSTLMTAIFSYLAFVYVVTIFSQVVFSQQTLIAFIVKNVAIATILTGVALRYFYMQFHWRENLESQSEAKVEALQARIRPHFLFNSLNTIATLTRSSPDRAEAAVEDLADLFRASLANQTMVPLREEVAVVWRYINIERLRLGDRLQIDIHIEDLPGDLLVPSLSLQPLVENAIYHGIEPLPDGGQITISGEVNDGEVMIIVTNPKPKVVYNRRRKGNQMALENIRQRFSLVYGSKGVMESFDEGDSYKVVIRVPFQEKVG